MRMKKAGQQAKDEEDFIKRVNRAERVDEVLAGIAKITGDAKSVSTKFVNAYRRGFSNTYSMFNSIMGKDLAKKYDPLLKEDDRNTAIYFKTKEMNETASKIYDTKNIFEVFKKIMSKDYEITDFEGLTTEISKMELINIYNSLKNDATKKWYYEAYGKEQLDGLIGELTVEDQGLGDYLQETLQEYRPIYSQRHIEITGRDLGFVENYWPRASEHQPDVFDDIRLQGETPSAMKERVKGKIIPIPKNCWFVAQKHIAQGEHVKHLSREYETLRRIFTNRKVSHAIKQKFGENVYGTILNQIDNISLNKQTAKIDAITDWMGKGINNWVAAKVAINPSSYVRQLMSVGNYMEHMPTVEWTKRFFEGIDHPRKTFDFMWKNAPFLEARFHRGYSEAMEHALAGANRLGTARNNYLNFLTAMVRSGDVTAIIYGGYPLVQHEMEVNKKSLQEAVDIFRDATLKAQQAGLSSSRSQFQNSNNPFARLFLAFKNTINQYVRKQVDAIISYHNSDITKGQMAKVLLIYGVIQPILYTLAGYVLKEGIKAAGRKIRGEFVDVEGITEKGLKEIIVQLVISPVLVIPIIDDMATFAMRRATGLKAYKVMSTPLFDDIETAMEKLTKKQPTAADYLEVAGSVLEPVTKFPVRTGLRYFRLITGKTGKKKPSRPKIGR